MIFSLGNDVNQFVFTLLTRIMFQLIQRLIYRGHICSALIELIE